jgi:hypothetical protein
MSLQRTVIPGMFVWLAAISLLHGWLKMGLFDRFASRGREVPRRFALASCRSPDTSPVPSPTSSTRTWRGTESSNACGSTAFPN